MKISLTLDQKLWRIKAIMDMHPERRYHISELNDTEFVDKYITNAFRLQFGESFYHYQLKNAMDYACRLLRRGISVKVAAISTGYETVNSFSRAYKKIYGIAPSQHQNCIEEKKKHG